MSSSVMFHCSHRLGSSSYNHSMDRREGHTTQSFWVVSLFHFPHQCSLWRKCVKLHALDITPADQTPDYQNDSLDLKLFGDEGCVFRGQGCFNGPIKSTALNCLAEQSISPALCLQAKSFQSTPNEQFTNTLELPIK